MRVQRAERGFTLLEMLIAATMMALLSTALVFAWRVSTSAWDRALAWSENERRVTQVDRLLRMQIASIVPVQPWLDRGRLDAFFQGEPRLARFVSRYSLAERAGGGLVLVEYAVVRASELAEQDRAAASGGLDGEGLVDDGLALVLRETELADPAQLASLLTGTEAAGPGERLQFPPFDAAAAPSHSRTVVLLGGLSEAEFEYYRVPTVASAEDAAGWRGEWTSAGDRMPVSMAVRLEAIAGIGVSPVAVIAAIPAWKVDEGPASPGGIGTRRRGRTIQD